MLSNYPPGVTGNESYFDAPPMFQDKNGVEIFFGDKVLIVDSDSVGIFEDFSQGEVDLDENGDQSWIPDMFCINTGAKFNWGIECEYINDDEYDIFRSDNIERL